VAKQTAKKSTRSRGHSTTRAQGKRTLIKPKGDARYIRRDAKGRIRESDDMGRSLKQDRAKKAKKKVQSGYGDRGDR
jgi:ribosome recycling factor